MAFKRALSIIFSTPLFALYLHILLSITQEGYLSTKNQVILFLHGLFFLSILPILPVLYDAWRGKTDIFVRNREERPKYFLFAIAMYLLGSVTSMVFGAKLMALFLLCYLTVTLSLLILTYWTKVSVHVAGVAGPLTYIVYFKGPIFILLFLLIPLVAWERVASNAHSLKQVALGALDSVAVTMMTILALGPLIL